MKQQDFNIVVIGGGHAGVEAALISKKLGASVLLITMDPSAVGRMSCNPAIGGLAKGQIVREIDLLGGYMGKIADKTGIQFKILNKTKGRAVWSPRAQVDKRKYEKMVSSLLKSSGVSIVAGEVLSLFYEKQNVSGVVLRDGSRITSSAVIITAGTFLSGIIHIGDRKIRAGRMGEERSEGLTEHLVSVGFRSGRLKTGTPPRIKKQSVNWDKLQIALGDKKPIPFSYFTKAFSPRNEPCHTALTNKKTHEIIQKNQKNSPMFSGDIGGAGPRYCPSIEDKVFRFYDRDSHLLFLEPEWEGADQIYINGFSTSLPEKTQIAALKTIEGMENVSFFRPGYAIEYDFFPPSQLLSTLETKNIGGLYFAGQMNGTSGYEEAAAQGLVAGINASLKIKEKDPLILPRDSSYTGVMIDDLITKDTLEPYRMFTSRAEYRLMLRFSNTVDRLIDYSSGIGVFRREECDFLRSVLAAKNEVRESLSKSILPSMVENNIKLNQPCPSRHVLKRTDVSIFDLPAEFRPIPKSLPGWLGDDILFDIESEIKYEGYIQRHIKEIKNIKKNDSLLIPIKTNYPSIPGLSKEAIEKLSSICPENMGQATRIPGITPADISVLNIYLSKDKGFT